MLSLTEALAISTSSKLGGPMVKKPLQIQEMRVRSLTLGDPLEKEVATHSSILAWEIPRTQEPGGL